MSDELNAPPGVDPTRASVARVYDYLLGGKDHYEADRKVAESIMVTMPEIADATRENRAFLIRVCRFLATNAGITQFLDCGSGLPTAENVHQVVQRINPESKVVYTDYDPIVAANGRALLEDNDRTRYVEADIFEPESILDNETVRTHLNWDQPIAVLFVATLHHHKGDRGRPAEVTAEFVKRLPSGSYVVISHLVDPSDGSGDDQAIAELQEVLRSGSLKGVIARTKAEIRELFHEAELISPGPDRTPEIVPLIDWWPDGPLLRPPNIAQRIMVGGVARKP
ncbi:SAM-dependent methyltransferase [Amycolatopsis sp. FDAARGOS 1241]|uniref:SAM-dependent methyltransferase n=1 Tax=Amycolatopsis sp. FDAARGOS 1241 TaxID=2778070 RepID=UPI0019511B65|nr:SAM-dependent methyltransferase [Amycolatopsis sp. FDAARGOS 1241]QRP44746.1 SAM-dependent methyltransferase [Amycolatopsis sp. FDAARGOS 1241]